MSSLNLFTKKELPVGEAPTATPRSGIKFADILAPSALEINSQYLQLGSKFLKTFFVISYPRYLNTGWFSPIVNLDKIFDISIFIHPIDTAAVLKNLRKKLTEVQSQISAEEAKGKVRNPMLETAHGDIENLRDSLMQATEKMFRIGFYITIYADSEKNLIKSENEIKSLLEARIIYTKQTVFQQDSGFLSTLPINIDKLEIHTPMNTQPVATFFPFTSADVTSDRGILYGINRHNNSLILFDRFSLENANMVIFAKSGGGKSYTAKLEILRSLMMGIEVIIIDPENEYEHLSDTVGGSFVKISLSSKNHINPFELPLPLPDENPADVLRGNIINLLGLMRLMFGGLTPDEDALLDRALAETYAARDITPESDFSNISPPMLNDFLLVLQGMTGAETIVKKLEKFTIGTFSNFLNQPTNVDINNKLVIFSIRDLEQDLRPIAMYVITRYIWNKIRSEKKKRILLVDEAWVMMQNEDAAAFLFGIAKRCRKYFLGLTTITQDVSDFMTSKYGKAIVTNSSLQLLLKQSPATIDVLAEIFNLTEEEKYLLLQSNVGEGIFIAGLKRAAIKVIASYTEDQIVTSNPQQLVEIEQSKQELAQTEKRKLG